MNQVKLINLLIISALDAYVRMTQIIEQVNAQVGELFAMEDKSSLSESELSLMTLISQTSLGTRASPSSNYHFAAHMGQLLVGIDGNKCKILH